MSGRHVGARQRVVEHRPGQQLTGIVVDRLFPERLADALHDAAVHLPLDDHRVDLRAAIVDRHVSLELHLARFPIDLDDRQCAPNG